VLAAVKASRAQLAAGSQQLIRPSLPMPDPVSDADTDGSRVGHDMSRDRNCKLRPLCATFVGCIGHHTTSGHYGSA